MATNATVRSTIPGDEYHKQRRAMLDGSPAIDRLLSARARAQPSSVIRELLELTSAPHILSMAGGIPDPALFPTSRIAAALDRLLAADPAALLQYGLTEGTVELRTLLADRSHGRFGPDDHLVTTGSQQGLDLLARVLLDPGDTVVVEAPTYLGAVQAMTAQSAVFEAIPADADGLRTDILEDRLGRGLRPKACYTVPNFQNPSGATLALDRRRHLAALAERFRFVVIEDDPYGELRFRGTAIAPISTFTDHAVTLGTASKILAPGLRVGWLTAPSWLRSALVRAKQGADLHTSTLSQHLVAALLGDVDAHHTHLELLRRTYRTKAEALERALHERLGSAIRATSSPEGGMFVWARIVDDAVVDSAVLLASALEHGTAFVPGTAFFPAPAPAPARRRARPAVAGRGATDSDGRRHLRLSFATLTPGELDIAAGRLADAIEACTAQTACGTR